MPPLCVCVCACMLHLWNCLWNLEKGVRFFEAGITGSCKSSHVGVGIWTWILWMNSSFLYTSSHLSSDFSKCLKNSCIAYEKVLSIFMKSLPGTNSYPSPSIQSGLFKQYSTVGRFILGTYCQWQVRWYDSQILQSQSCSENWQF